MKNKVNLQNVVTVYRISKYFNFTDLAEPARRYIERFFTLVYENCNFLNLDFTQITNIISSSELCIDSELEVINAIEAWVSFNFRDRNKFGSRLLSKVRLHLLSESALKSLLNGKFSFKKNFGCFSMLTKALRDKKTVRQNKLSNSNQSRYCCQSAFDVVLSGGNQDGGSCDHATKFAGESLKFTKHLAPMQTRRDLHDSVYCKGSIFLFGGYNHINYVKNIEKYSLANNTWEYVGNMYKDIKDFCACAFMDKIYIIGGMKEYEYFTDLCMGFDTKDNKWSKVARMNEIRSNAASAVFEGKVVVSGGIAMEIKNTVEAYDHVDNSWTPMPNMIEGRYGHTSVAMRNKLFVIGSINGNRKASCEVFDSDGKKFVALKTPPNSFTTRLECVVYTFLIGSKLVTFNDLNLTTVLLYDVKKKEWSERKFEGPKNNVGYGCAITPQLKF